MVDWPGLLKWSLKYQDETSSSEKKEWNKMDEKTYKWLTEAFESVTINEIEAMKKLISSLNEPENAQDPCDEENRLNLLDQLFDFVETLDRSLDLCKLDGIQLLLKIILESKYKELRILANQIFQFCNQNKSEVQSFCISLGAFKLVNVIINEKEDISIREFALSSLSSMIRGECLQAKRNFIEMDGIQLILEILANKTYSNRLRTKAILLLKDLVFYDDKLHLTYNDLTPFQNTNVKLNGKEKASSKIQVNQNSVQKEEENKQEQQLQNINNELLENQKYKHFVKNFVISNFKFLSMYDQFLVDKDLPNVDSRCAYLFIIKELIKYSANILDQNEKNKLLEFLIKHTAIIEAENKKNEGSYWHEVDLLKELFVVLKS